MKTKNKHQHAGGEVTELARETAKVEQYWIVGDRSEPRKPPKNYNYVEELIHLQIELIKLQEYVRHNRLKMCVIFEGRDAAGKGGIIKRQPTDSNTTAVLLAMGSSLLFAPATLSASRSGGRATKAKNVGANICDFFGREDQVRHLRVRRCQEHP